MNTRGINLVLSAGVLIVSAASMLIGRTSSGPTFGPGDAEIAATVLRELRLPRTLLGLLVGGSLGLCGAALQGLLRNPLAEPGILGTSSSAAFGAVVVFYFGLASQQSLLLPAGAIVGSIVALLVILTVSGRRASLVTLVLTGIAINALAAALTTGRIGGAGIDVLPEEPPVKGDPLLDPAIPNLIVTPHSAWAGRQSRQNVVDETVANIRAFLAGEPRNRVA